MNTNHPEVISSGKTHQQAGQPWMQHKMVGWYDPRQLLHTAVQVIVSETLGTRADFRVLEGLGGEQKVFDYSTKNEIWVDYVADLGDGWNSTYAIASLLAAKTLPFSQPRKPDETEEPMITERGHILVMGGDEVYPVASQRGYLERTVGPYECALEESAPPQPSLFAIPGNHDWYDGLVSFSRLFCQGRWIGGWKTEQTRSYFALKLPGGWWLWGVDVQLESDIDRPQLEYFMKVAAEMREGDRVILATAEPHWIYGNIYDPRLQNNLAFLERKVIHKAKARVMVMLAGDLHHYRRHEASDGSQVQLITSGGGGAFLHPTHGPPVEEVKVGPPPGVRYRLKAAFPTAEVSKRLLLQNLLFPFLNPRLGVLTGLVYVSIAWVLRAPLQGEVLVDSLAEWRVGRTARLAVEALLQSPPAFTLLFLVLAGFVLFTDTHKKLYKYLAGLLHGLAHLFGIFLVGWLASGLVHRSLNLPVGSLGAMLSVGLGLFLGGYLAGPFLMGLYLYISLRVFRRHSNEAFSGLQIQDYKNFLRLRLDAAGRLTIFPIGVKRVPRKWQLSGSGRKDEPQLIPADGIELKAELIEPPIFVGQ